MYLIDTMVLSERSKASADRNAIGWLETLGDEQDFLSVVTIGEIERGIHKLEKREGRSATRHRRWLETTLTRYGERILPITIDIARRWGELSHRAGNANVDLLIAATALEHDLTVVTRNTRHFAPTGVRVLNPYLPS